MEILVELMVAWALMVLVVEVEVDQEVEMEVLEMVLAAVEGLDMLISVEFKY